MGEPNLQAIADALEAGHEALLRLSGEALRIARDLDRARRSLGQRSKAEREGGSISPLDPSKLTEVELVLVDGEGAELTDRVRTRIGFAQGICVPETAYLTEEITFGPAFRAGADVHMRAIAIKARPPYYDAGQVLVGLPIEGMVARGERVRRQASGLEDI